MTPVRLKPAALRSQVKHSTTEPLCSLLFVSVPEGCLILANSANPDEMQHYAAFHLGLHSLHKYPFIRGFQCRKGWVNISLIQYLEWIFCGNNNSYMHSFLACILNY